jgi:2-polyprenyl-6-methoxyphenol hydroxylase-like FAD-dependent oxidoreductase
MEVGFMQDVPVIIVGAGPVGLTTSILLSRLGVPSLLVEKRSGVSPLPRARGVTQRTVEIWSQFGLYDELTEISLPPGWCHKFIYVDTLDGQVIGEMPSNSMSPGANAAFTARDFRCTSSDLIDSMLLRHAKTYPLAQVRFNQELTDFEQDANGVTATIEDRQTGERRRIRSRFLVGADGANSFVRERAGIKSVGAFSLRSYVNTYFNADLSRWTEGREAALIWTLARGVEGCFQPLDGKQRWMCQIQLSPEEDPQERWAPERVISHIRDMIGLQGREVDIELHSAATYTISALIAERLRDGRVLLVGDAAHKIPPFGSFGMNTGVQTAHNLAWKLAAVLSGAAPSALLDTFDLERREVALRVCSVGRVNAAYVAAIQAAETLEGKRAAIAASTSYGNWVGIDLGVYYERAGAFVPDETPPPAIADPVSDYKPTAKPGHRAPHFWARIGADRLSSVDLFQRDFVVLTGAKGKPWITAAKRIGAQGTLGLTGYQVGPTTDLVSESILFTQLYGIEDTGVVLVRPDGHVAFRSPMQSAEPEVALRNALKKTLNRS